MSRVTIESAVTAQWSTIVRSMSWEIGATTRLAWSAAIVPPEARFHCMHHPLKGLGRLAVLDDDVDQTTPEELVRGIDLAREDQVVGDI